MLSSVFLKKTPLVEFLVLQEQHAEPASSIKTKNTESSRGSSSCLRFSEKFTSTCNRLRDFIFRILHVILTNVTDSAKELLSCPVWSSDGGRTAIMVCGLGSRTQLPKRQCISASCSYEEVIISASCISNELIVEIRSLIFLWLWTHGNSVSPATPPSKAAGAT